jgi:hypothetical protein
MKLSLNARRTRQRLRIRVPASPPSFGNALQADSFGIWVHFRKVRRQPFSYRLGKDCPSLGRSTKRITAGYFRPTRNRRPSRSQVITAVLKQLFNPLGVGNGLSLFVCGQWFAISDKTNSGESLFILHIPLQMNHL